MKKELIAWLEQKTQKDTSERLPTDRELAARFDVSPRTVFSVMQIYTRRGTIVRIRGRGTFTGKPPAASPAASPSMPGNSVQRVAALLREQLFSGGFKIGEPLPPIKEVCNRYRISATTASSAYRMLRSEGLIRKGGKTFWVRPHLEEIGTTRGRPLYLFRFQHTDFSHIFESNQIAAAAVKMEYELQKYGYLLNYENTVNLPALINSWSSDGRFPFGLIFFQIDTIAYKTLVPLLEKLVEKSARTSVRIPVLIDWHTGRYRKRCRGVRVIARGHILTSVARELAAFLTRDSQRSEAVFFMNNEGRIWNFPLFYVLLRIVREVHRMMPAFTFRIVIHLPECTEANIDRLRREKLPAIIHTLGDVEENEQTNEYERLTSSIHFTDNFGKEYSAMRTAGTWVFSEDADAVDACTWARSERIDVPRRIEVLSLQNHPRFFAHGITACVPDWETIGYLMAHAIIGDFPVAKTSEGFIRTRARIIRRRTTRE